MILSRSRYGGIKCCCEGQTLVDTLDTYYEVITMTPNTYSMLIVIHFVS